MVKRRSRFLRPTDISPLPSLVEWSFEQLHLWWAWVDFLWFLQLIIEKFVNSLCFKTRKPWIRIEIFTIIKVRQFLLSNNGQCNLLKLLPMKFLQMCYFFKFWFSNLRLIIKIFLLKNSFCQSGKSFAEVRKLIFCLAITIEFD